MKSELRRIKLTDEQFKLCRSIQDENEAMPAVLKSLTEKCIEDYATCRRQLWDQLDQLSDRKDGEVVHLEWITGDLVVYGESNVSRESIIKSLGDLKELAVTELFDFNAAAALRDCADRIRSLGEEQTK